MNPNPNPNPRFQPTRWFKEVKYTCKVTLLGFSAVLPTVLRIHLKPGILAFSACRREATAILVGDKHHPKRGSRQLGASASGGLWAPALCWLLVFPLLSSDRSASSLSARGPCWPWRSQEDSFSFLLPHWACEEAELGNSFLGRSLGVEPRGP